MVPVVIIPTSCNTSTSGLVCSVPVVIIPFLKGLQEGNKLQLREVKQQREANFSHGRSQGHTIPRPGRRLLRHGHHAAVEATRGKFLRVMFSGLGCDLTTNLIRCDTNPTSMVSQLRETGLLHPYAWYEREYGISASVIYKWRKRGLPIDDPVALFRIVSHQKGLKPPLQKLMNIVQGCSHRVNGAHVMKQPNGDRPNPTEGGSAPNVAPGARDLGSSDGTITIKFPRITFTRPISLEEVHEVMGEESWETLQT